MWGKKSIHNEQLIMKKVEGKKAGTFSLNFILIWCSL